MSAAARRVLFVEGDESLRLLVQRVLSRGGIEADLTGEAHDAIRRLATEKYQVVVIDLVANDSTPHEVIRALSLIPPRTRPVVIATGDPSGNSRLDAEVISLVLRKPYDVQALAEIIGSSISIDLGAIPNEADEGLPLC